MALLRKQCLQLGILPDDVNEQDFFTLLETLKAREREDRTELIDPAASLGKVERRYLGNGDAE